MKRRTELRGLVWRMLGYTAYGYSQKEPAAALGFNGERKDELLQAYALGNGYRFYCPALLRFFSPDVLSPFGKGGVNTYSYCQGDPVNRLDPTGGIGTLRRLPGRARPVAVVRPVEAIEKRNSPKAVEQRIPLGFKNGPGKYQLASTVPREVAKYTDFRFTEHFTEAPVKARPVERVTGVQSQGPTIDELGESWYWQHRPGTQPMRLREMIPNHQRAQSSQIAEIEQALASIREQEILREIEIEVLASSGY